MIRTQIYIEEKLHKELLRFAARSGEPMAKIARDMLREGLAKKQESDRSGRKTLLALAKMNITGGGIALSENIDHYLYGAPQKHA